MQPVIYEVYLSEGLELHQGVPSTEADTKKYWHCHGGLGQVARAGGQTQKIWHCHGGWGGGGEVDAKNMALAWGGGQGPKSTGTAQSRTGVSGFRVHCDNHYTTAPRAADQLPNYVIYNQTSMGTGSSRNTRSKR